MIRSDVLKDNDIRYRHFLHAEDADLYWRLSRHGVLYNLKEYVGYYRIHTGSVSAASRNARIQMVSAALAAVSQQRFLRDGGDIDAAGVIDLTGLSLIDIQVDANGDADWDNSTIMGEPFVPGTLQENVTRVSFAPGSITATVQNGTLNVLPTWELTFGNDAQSGVTVNGTAHVQIAVDLEVAVSVPGAVALRDTRYS